MNLITIILTNALMNVANALMDGSITLTIFIGILTILMLDVNSSRKINKVKNSCEFKTLVILVFINVLCNTLVLLFVTNIVAIIIWSTLISIAFMVATDTHYYKFK